MILVGLGSNQRFCGASSQQVLGLAARALNQAAIIVAASRVFGAPAWPDPADPPFANAVVAVEWEGSPESLLKLLHRIEAAFGRRRGRRNAPRTLDLDLLAFHDVVCEPAGVGGVQLPHPRLHERDFVLAPICDIAPTWRHPRLGTTAQALLDALPEQTAEPLGPALLLTQRASL